MKKRLALIAVALLALSGACSEFVFPPSGSDGGPPAPGDGGSGKDGGLDGGTDGGLLLGAACGLFGARRCQYLQRCGLIEGSSQALRDCQSYYSATSCRASRWPARVDAGTLRFDPYLAQACADAFLSLGCADLESEPLACQRFLSPGSYLSGPCYGQYQECRDSVCRGAACPRTCQAPGLVDEPCDEPGDCRQDAGLFCRFQTATPGVGRCTALGRSGDACDAERACSPELFCNNLGQCESRRKVAEPCISGTCVESAWCHFTPSDGGYCADRQLAAQACTDDVQCQQGLLCEPLLGTCVTAGPAADGGACSLRQRCLPPNVCVGASPSVLGSCLAPVSLGAQCSSSLDCEPHLSCAVFDGGIKETCGPRLADGSPCEGSRDCRVYSRCVNHSCMPLPPPGSPCVAGQCLFGRCELADGGPWCVDIGGPGASCLADSECVSSRCVSGKCLAACGP